MLASTKVDLTVTVASPEPLFEERSPPAFEKKPLQNLVIKVKMLKMSLRM